MNPKYAVGDEISFAMHWTGRITDRWWRRHSQVLSLVKKLDV